MFETPLAMALWIQKNLGLHKTMQIDRIDNSRHYEPGNLRYATSKQNQSNTRSPRWNAMMHSFRMRHPEIRYADSTLRGMFIRGLTEDQIIKRFYQHSYKPKGVYGTFSTPDPVIASLLKDS
jgi:hypothetical protein